LGIDFLAPHRQLLEQALAPNYQAILDAYVARRSGAADATLTEPVLAPTELADDDAAEPEAPLQPADELGPEPQPPPDPIPVPGKSYPKPFRQMSPLQKSIHYREWSVANEKYEEEKRAYDKKKRELELRLMHQQN
jgi:hypothetical protein